MADEEKKQKSLKRGAAREIVMLPISEVRPYEKNPRKNTEAVKYVKASIEKFGFKSPIIVDSNRVIVCGHTRLLAAKSLGMAEVPCIFADDLTDEQVKAYRLADNKVAEFAEWDSDLLNMELGDLDDIGDIDMTQFGFDLFEEEQQEEITEDEVPEEVEPVCKQGDVWQLGEHRLMCGDSTDAEQVSKLMDGEKADMVFTDPPYGVSYADKNEFLNSLGTGHRLTKRIENDSHKPEEMYEFWCKSFKNLYDFSKDCMAYYVTAPQGGDLLLLLLLQSLRDSGFMLKHQLIWNKNNHVLGRCDYNYKHEPIIYGWKIDKTHHFYGKSKFKTSVWDIPKPLKSDLHPTMKPVELVTSCLLDASEKGQVVLDLFGGSGTTLIAAEETKRHARLMEYDPHYCDVIIARWEKLTGQKAVKLGGDNGQ